MTDMIDWPGGECPVDDGEVCEVRLRNRMTNVDLACNFAWEHYQGPSGRGPEIVAYRVLPTFADVATLTSERAANEALTNECERLRAELAVAREAMSLYLKWREAEQDHTGTTFWKRVEMCRAAENAVRAAIKGEA